MLHVYFQRRWLLSPSSQLLLSVFREEKEVPLSEYSGLTCSHLILNATQKQGTFSNLSLCTLQAESAPVQKGCTWGQWDAAALQVCSCSHSTCSDHRHGSWVTWNQGSLPCSNDLNFCVNSNTGSGGESSSDTALAMTEIAKASTESQWTVNRHETDFSCLLCSVKL